MPNLLKFLNSKRFNDFSRVLEYGKTQQQIDLYDLRESDFELVEQPIFFLSTGRCGTAWLTNLLEKDPLLKLFHHPVPVMRSQGKLAYEFSLDRKSLTERERNLMLEMFLAGREELFINCAKAKKRPVFTDSRSTFFAYEMLQLFPNAKFVHLHRHPGEFVRSGIRRSWYKAKNQSELNRITPLERTKYFKDWSSFSEIQKVSWLWEETNLFIEEFGKQLNPENFLTLRFNNWSESSLVNLLSFIKSDISAKTVSELLNVKVNAQSQVDFPKYKAWTDIDKQQLINICGERAHKYNYNL